MTKCKTEPKKPKGVAKPVNDFAIKSEASDWIAITWIIPSFGNPDGLSKVLDMLNLDSPLVSAVVIVETGDKNLLIYQEILERQGRLGRKVGRIYSHGGNLCGAVNYIASVCNTSHSFCVISDMAVPQSDSVPLYDAVTNWLKTYACKPNQAAIGLFAVDNDNPYALFPVVSRGAVGRLGYLYHPVCMFRSLAEAWLLDVARMAGKLTLIPGVKLMSAGFVDDIRTEDYDECRLVYERHLPGIRRIDAQRIKD